MELAGLDWPGLDWPVPDFSTVSRRQKGLSVAIPYRPSTGARVHVNQRSVNKPSLLLATGTDTLSHECIPRCVVPGIHDRLDS